jgi:hypothetical protein
MAGGTSVPPQDSGCEPWSGKTKDSWYVKRKTDRAKRSRRSDGEVSLDNADEVIDGGPRLVIKAWGFSRSYATRKTTFD